MIVVDLGCHDRGGMPSLQTLVDEYRPDIIYGFDPECDPSITSIGGVPCHLTASAAWVYDGTVGWKQDANASRVLKDGADIVPCFDFSIWLQDIGPAVVKMDIEGAEYELLQHMIVDGSDRYIDELLIEWHPKPDPLILDALDCPVREWWM